MILENVFFLCFFLKKTSTLGVRFRPRVVCIVTVLEAGECFPPVAEPTCSPVGDLQLQRRLEGREVRVRRDDQDGAVVVSQRDARLPLQGTEDGGGGVKPLPAPRTLRVPPCPVGVGGGGCSGPHHSNNGHGAVAVGAKIMGEKIWGKTYINKKRTIGEFIYKGYMQLYIKGLSDHAWINGLWD